MGGADPEGDPEDAPEGESPDDARAPEPKVSRRLLESLVCPATGARLEYDAGRGELISRSAGLAYPIRSGIPIMLIDEARKLEQ